MIVGNTVGSLSIYQCLEGYLLRGNMLRTCNPTGLWSGEEPFCSRMQLINQYNNNNNNNKSIQQQKKQTSEWYSYVICRNLICSLFTCSTRVANTSKTEVNVNNNKQTANRKDEKIIQYVAEVTASLLVLSLFRSHNSHRVWSPLQPCGWRGHRNWDRPRLNRYLLLQ